MATKPFEKKFKFRTQTTTPETTILNPSNEDDKTRIGQLENIGFKGGKKQNEADIIKAEEFNFLLTTIEYDLNGIQTDSSNLHNEVNTEHSKNESQDAALSRIRTSVGLTEFETLSTSHKAEIASLKSRISSAESKLTSVVNKVGEITSTSNSSGTIYERINDLKSQLSTLKLKVDSIDRIVKENSSSISTLKSTTESHTSEISLLQTEVNKKANTAEFTPVKETVTQLKQDVDEIKKKYETSSLYFDSIESKTYDEIINSLQKNVEYKCCLPNETVLLKIEFSYVLYSTVKKDSEVWFGLGNMTTAPNDGKLKTKFINLCGYTLDGKLYPMEHIYTSPVWDEEPPVGTATSRSLFNGHTWH